MSKTLRTATVKAHVTPGERQQLVARAHRLGLTVSDYIRRVMINFRLPESAINARSVRDLYKVNADLARLGNLLKMAMDDVDLPVPRSSDLAPESLFQRMEEARQLLKTKIEKL
ncbi:MAG: hypothetical protein HOL66_02825 [Rhodospirillaceae bacterium]|jgi:hypothetical protein|nr:hypothetical protein [Rhodospirillaceae bacterium]MBT5243162.1 hypothetical protein [Rhodospirillaceae bacterium]MBT5563387.1 hypothetical protein [Rhodospirillaceae bacterium]MBT6243701.1 hypothetical protein [Rhodospirillaceae bacterium]MBT7136998.1 hypothetical protein [Rhodospirillaceae bacterium]